ncbi:hypothetical protein TNCV_2253181 [Trichonephila clavipes]|nr:hypothetical protein TNCV_2253181 [Trichonephila clavipes]
MKYGGEYEDKDKVNENMPILKNSYSKHMGDVDPYYCSPITRKYPGDPPVDCDRRNAHPGSSPSFRSFEFRFEEHSSYKLFIFAISGRKGNEKSTGNDPPGDNKERTFSGNRFTTHTEFTSSSARKLKKKQEHGGSHCSMFCVVHFGVCFSIYYYF